jgi:hypothetical protein
VLVAASLLATGFHFADNTLRFVRFPEPRWISGPHIVVALWLAITPLLLGGWWLAHHKRLRLARFALQLYAAVSLSVLGHYAYPARSLSLAMHVGIGVDALAAVVLLLRAPSLLRAMRAA